VVESACPVTDRDTVLVCPVSEVSGVGELEVPLDHQTVSTILLEVAVHGDAGQLQVIEDRESFQSITRVGHLTLEVGSIELPGADRVGDELLEGRIDHLRRDALVVAADLVVRALFAGIRGQTATPLTADVTAGTTSAARAVGTAGRAVVLSTGAAGGRIGGVAAGAARVVVVVRGRRAPGAAGHRSAEQDGQEQDTPNDHGASLPLEGRPGKNPAADG